MKKRFDFELHRQDQFRTIASQRISTYPNMQNRTMVAIFFYTLYIGTYVCTNVRSVRRTFVIDAVRSIIKIYNRKLHV